MLGEGIFLPYFSSNTLMENGVLLPKREYVRSSTGYKGLPVKVRRLWFFPG
jgi:hypothetical protein